MASVVRGVKVWATPDDAAQWGVYDASETDCLSASLLVSQAVTGWWDELDAAGLPTTPAVLDALREATCAVVKARDDAGPTPGLTAAKLGTADYTLSVPATVAGDRLPAEASAILGQAGLLTLLVFISG
jgi:hypothetical protein